MRLRLRLVLTTLAVGLPLIAAMGWFEHYAFERAAEDALSAFVLAYMQTGGRERCEAAPATWSVASAAPPAVHGEPPPFRGRPLGDGPGWPHPRMDPFARLYAYGSDLVSANPVAPPIDAPLREAIAAASSAERQSGDREEILFRMPWSAGPCAFVLAEKLRPPMRGFVPSLRLWFPPTFAVLGALLIALGPLVRRLRQLTAEVRASAQAQYAPRIDVEGNDEIAELARAFDGAAREIRSQLAQQAHREQALRDFLDNTTHDVMIPLTILQGHLADLQRAAGDSALATSAIREAHYIASLVHNLSVAAKLESDAPEIARAPVDLNALIDRVVARHLPVAKRSGVELGHAVPETALQALAEVTFAEQAVSNLVYNAVRYNHAGGHVAVQLDRLAEDHFRIRVVDDGPGIPPEELARVRDRHYRGDEARSRVHDGRGLGLHIAFTVTERHGWELVLGRSEYGGLQADLTGALMKA